MHGCCENGTIAPSLDWLSSVSKPDYAPTWVFSGYIER